MCLGASSIPWCRRPRDCNAAVLLPHHLEVHLLLLPALLQRKDVNPVTASAAMPVLRTPPPPRTKDAGPAVAQGRRIRCGLRLGAERTPVPSRQSSRAWRWRGCPRRLRQPRGTYVDPSPCLIVMCAMCLPHPPPPRPPMAVVIVPYARVPLVRAAISKRHQSCHKWLHWHSPTGATYQQYGRGWQIVIFWPTDNPNSRRKRVYHWL